jgi:hypothetical protein
VTNQEILAVAATKAVDALDGFENAEFVNMGEMVRAVGLGREYDEAHYAVRQLHEKAVAAWEDQRRADRERERAAVEGA